MNDLNNVVREVCSNVKRYEIYRNSIIYKDEENKKHVVKTNENNILDIYNYLGSRGFNYLPRLEYCNKDAYIYEYVPDVSTPNEQKISDLVKMDALLHNKTVYYKDVSLDEVKELYEDLGRKIDDTYKYYDDLVTMIESNVYMSPSEYMLARNCSLIFSCLNFCHKELDEWYEIMKTKSKKRVVLLHNNLDVKNIIKANDNILIGWNKATRDIPIYDFIRLYKKDYDKYDFNELYREYKKRFPLTSEERKLMFIILFLPDKIEFKDKEILSSATVSKLCNYLILTDKLFMENETKDTKEQDNKINE